MAGADNVMMSGGQYGPTTMKSGDESAATLYNPGTIDLAQQNPAAYQQLQMMQLLQGQFQNSVAGGAFNPSFYKEMQDTQQANLTNSLQNQYARMGLGGSSLAMGGLNQAIQSNQINWLNRQQSDQMRALQGMQSLSGTINNDIYGIQNQYQKHQNDALDMMFGLRSASQAQANSENQLWAGMIGGLLSGGGAAMGGAMNKYSGQNPTQNNYNPSQGADQYNANGEWTGGSSGGAANSMTSMAALFA